MPDPPGAENDGPAQRSEEELTNFIKEAMTAYNEHNFRDYDLWESFTDDFKGWTLQDFRTAIQWHVRRLRIQLRTRGVFVQKFGGATAAETLFITSKEELSVSRPVERLTWGIPVPDDDTQTIYVWLDALINYLTKSNYPFQIPGQENAAGWPADVHVIGKDIVRFHCIYWPAFLMALNLPLPQQVLTHAQWTLGHEKMSKSTGNIVNPFFALDRFGVDTMRYYLAHDGGIRDDADYENAYIIDRYKKGLQGGLGNLVSRVMRGKGWNIREAIVAATNGDAPAGEALSIKLRTRLLKLPDMVMNSMEKLDSGAALRAIMNTIYMTNTYMQQSAPWDYKDGGDKAHLNRIIYLCVESIRICGILLQPYMPGKMEQLMEMLGVAPDARKFENAILSSDSEYGIPKVPLGKGREGVLFPDLRSDS